MRLRTQLLLLTLGPLLAGGAFAVVLMWEPVDRLLLAAVEQEAQAQLEIQGQALEADLGSLQARLDAYASMPAIREGTPASIARALIPRRADVPGIDVLNFVAATGVVHQPDGSLLNVRNRPYFPAVQRGEPYVSRALISVDGGTPEIMVLRPVRRATGVVTGAVGASLRLTDMLERIRSIRLSHPGFVLLVDADGRTLSGARLPGVMTTSALLNDSVPDRSPPAWRAMLDTMRHAGNGTTTLVLEDERYRVSFRHLPSLEWQMAVGFEETALFAPRNRIALRALLVFLLIAAVGAGAAVTVRRRVGTPLVALADAQARVARGDLTARAPVPSQSELAQLATSFNGMADDLQAHERERHAESLRRAEAAAVLAEHEAMLRAVFDASPMAIAVFREEDGCYVRANAAFAQLCGLTPADVIGRSVEELGLVQDAAQRAYMRERRQREGSVQTERVRRADAQGRVRDLLVSAVQFVVNDEPLVLVASVDISETVRLEAQLRQSQKLDVVGRLAGGVAHDFNNMLTGIIGAADLIGTALDTDATLQEEVSVIRQSAARAATLTKQLLTFSRVHPVTTQVLDAHEPVRAALALARRTFNRRVVIEEALEAPTSRVRGDAALLQTVVMNLLVNARDAMADSGIVRVRSRNRSASESDSTSVWVLEVQDTGHGMTADVAERIFEPFYTTKAPGQGTGLGLSVAFGIMREHGGDIQVSSAVNAGTTFTLTLPLVTATADALLTPTSMAAITTGRTHVLVVDDEAMVRATTARALRLAGHTVHVAADGMAAIAIVGSGISIDVAVLDLVMPGMDGVETLRALRERLPALPVVIASGYGADGAFQTLAAIPGVQFLPKPFGMAELTAAVARAVESHVDTLRA